MSLIFNSLLNLGTPVTSDAGGEWKVISPAHLERELGKCQYRFAEIETAVVSARQSKSLLSKLSFSEKLSVIRNAALTLQREKATLFDLASQELGRGRADLEQEWRSLELFLALCSDQSHLPEIENSVPRGISVVLGSQVWPIFHSVNFAFLNFLAGNEVILKPSEKASLTVLKLFELLRAAHSEFFSIQVLLGEREVGRRLACHEGVSTVIFQGCFEVGIRVRQDNLSQPAKEVLLYLGAKNPSIVFQDAPEEVFEVLLRDAFQGTGQDCKSISLAFVERPFLKEFSKRFHERSKNFSIGPPETNAFMGPLIDGAMLDRYYKFIGISEREGAEILMRGKPLLAAGKGHYITPTLALFETLSPEQMRKSVSLQTETLSPHLSMVGFEDEAHLLLLLEQMNHGRTASVWTADRNRARRLADSIEYGAVVINGSTLDANPKECFQARKRSGNHALYGMGLLSQLVHQKTVRTPE